MHSESPDARNFQVATVSHNGEGTSVAIHPGASGLFVTGGTDKILQFWSCTERKPLV